MAYRGYIYSITNELNGKSYIGKTNDLVRRWKEHCYGHGGTAILNRAINKYGLEHFVFDIVAQIPFESIEEMNDVLKQLEIYYISLYDTYNNGYNATVGGDGISYYHHSEETKRKISESQIGKVLNEEHKAKCRVANLGNHHTEEAKEKIRQALLNRNPEIYERIAAKNRGVKRDHEMIMRGAAKRRKPVLQYDMEGNFIQELESLSQAGYGTTANIAACCKGRIVSAYGYVWRYKETDFYPSKINVPKVHSTHRKGVIQCDFEGNAINKFDSISSAAKSIGVHSDVLGKALRKSRVLGGFVWKYSERKEVVYA